MSNEVQNLLGFDDSDLAANRSGQLTEKQKKFLSGEHRSQQSVFAGVGGFVALIFCCLPVLVFGGRVLLPQWLADPRSFNLAEIMPFVAAGGNTLLLAVVVVGAVVVLYLVRSRRTADITVRQARGTIDYVWDTKRVRTPGSSVRSYEDVRVLIMRVGPERRFEVKEPFQNVFIEGEEWVIYYTSYPF